MEYIAFLRGINVGKNKRIAMTELQQAFENMKFTNVRTVLSTGNILFDATNANETSIEKHLEKTFGFVIPTILAKKKDVEKACDNATLSGKVFVSFTKKPIQVAGNKDIKTYCEKNMVFCSVAENTSTLDVMKFLEQHIGKNVTTRTLGTVKKLL